MNEMTLINAANDGVASLLGANGSRYTIGFDFSANPTDADLLAKGEQFYGVPMVAVRVRESIWE